MAETDQLTFERPAGTRQPEQLAKIGKKTIDVVLVHGAWHGAWCWEQLTPLLEEKGLNPVAVDLPTHNPRRTFDDYARLVAEAVGDSKEAILVGHSRGGDVIPRVVDRASSTKFHEMIFMASAFHRATIINKIPINEVPHPSMPRNSNDFDTGTLKIKSLRPWYRPRSSDTGDLTIFKDEFLKKVLYNQTPDDVIEWARERMGKAPNGGIQWRSDQEPTLKRWPSEVPSTYIRTLRDQAVRPEWQTHRARAIGALIVDMATDHTPQLSDPQGLAAIIAERASIY